MCVGISATAFAVTPTPAVQQPAAFSDIVGHEAESALTLLGAMGIYTGDGGLGGAVKPDDPITRAQFCKVIVTAMGRATTAAGLAGLQPTFTDGASIPTWAWGYVNVAVYMGIINGYADGSFGANNPVTYAEAVTMLIRAVPGHLAQVTPGVWPYNFLFYGVDEGFTGDACFGIVDVGFANLPAGRGDIAQMTVATMQKEKLDKDGLAVPGTAQLYMFEGDVDVWNYDANRVYFTATGWTDLSAKYWIVGAADLAGLRNLPVVYTYSSPTVFFLAVEGESNVVAGVFSKLSKADNDSIHDTIVLEDGTKVPFPDSGNVPVTWNQGSRYWLDALVAGDEVAITVDDDGLAVNVQATHFEDLDYVTDFTASVGGTTPVDTAIGTYNGYGYDVPADCRVYVNGALAGRDTLAVDDAFVVAVSDLSGDPFILRANRVAIEGTVAGTTTTYPGPVYRVTIDLKAGGSKTYILNDDGGIALPPEGAVVQYGLDFDGAIYVPIGYAELTPYAICKSYVIDGSGGMTATFDVKGVPVTYIVLESFQVHATDNEYLDLTIDTSTGTVTAHSVIFVGANCFAIVSLDLVNGTMTLWNTGVYYFVDDPTLVVYDHTRTYIGLAGLDVDDVVAWNGADPVFELLAP
jgi:hypothetical protein